MLLELKALPFSGPNTQLSPLYFRPDCPMCCVGTERTDDDDDNADNDDDKHGPNDDDVDDDDDDDDDA